MVQFSPSRPAACSSRIPLISIAQKNTNLRSQLLFRGILAFGSNADSIIGRDAVPVKALA
jgi:hypothetical protein